MYEINYVAYSKLNDKINIEYAEITGPKGGKYIVNSRVLAYIIRKSGVDGIEKLMGQGNLYDSMLYIINKYDIYLMECGKQLVSDKMVKELARRFYGKALIGDRDADKALQIAKKIKNFK